MFSLCRFRQMGHVPWDKCYKGRNADSQVSTCGSQQVVLMSAMSEQMLFERMQPQPDVDIEHAN